MKKIFIYTTAVFFFLQVILLYAEDRRYYSEGVLVKVETESNTFIVLQDKRIVRYYGDEALTKKFKGKKDISVTIVYIKDNDNRLIIKEIKEKPKKRKDSIKYSPIKK